MFLQMFPFSFSAFFFLQKTFQRKVLPGNTHCLQSPEIQETGHKVSQQTHLSCFTSCYNCCFKDDVPHFPLRGYYSQAGTKLFFSKERHFSVGLNSADSNTGKTLHIPKKKCITHLSLSPAISRHSAVSSTLGSLSPS